MAQRDIPRVLEGFVLYLEALEGLENSLVAEAGRSGKQANKEDMSRAIDEHVAPLQAGDWRVCTLFRPAADLLDTQRYARVFEKS